MPTGGSLMRDHQPHAPHPLLFGRSLTATVGSQLHVWWERNELPHLLAVLVQVVVLLVAVVVYDVVLFVRVVVPGDDAAAPLVDVRPPHGLQWQVRSITDA